MLENLRVCSPVRHPETRRHSSRLSCVDERRVLTLSWRLLGAMEDAQDAAQEVFLRTFKYLHRFDVRKPFEPWLVRMTVNVCRDLGRKRTQRGIVFCGRSDGYEQAEQPDSAGNPHDELQSEQQRQMLYRALNDLPEKERTAFVPSRIAGFDEGSGQVAGARFVGSNAYDRRSVRRGSKSEIDSTDRRRTSMNCEAFEKSIAFVCGKRCSRVERRRVEAHLENCVACRVWRTNSESQSVFKALRGWLR